MLRAKFAVLMFLALSFSLLSSLAAQAQSIHLYNTAGREIRTGNPFPLDRFSRGETAYIEISDNNGWYYWWVDSRRGLERSTEWDCYYSYTAFRVPTNSASDDVTVHVCDWLTGREVKLRIPIGTK